MDHVISTSIFSFAFGILLSSFLPITPLVSLFTLIIGVGILTVEKIWNGEINQPAIFLSIFLIFFSFGSLRYAVKDFHELKTPSTTGVVVTEPEDKENVGRFVYESDNGERVLVSTSLYTPVSYGDRVEVLSGRLERPGIIKGDEGERDFDYGKYLSKDDIYYTQSFAEVKVLTHGQGNFLKSFLFKIKSDFVQHAKAILTEPYSSLLLGLIVAGRDAMPKDILEEFRRAGVIHIVVLSGFNIILITNFIRRVFQKLFLLSGFAKWPKAPGVASIVGIFLFVIMTGAEATVVRAGIMALIVVLAKFSGRSYSATRALVLAGFLMLMHNPKILVFDPSFQLSFLATLGLIHIMPIIEKRLKFITERLEMRVIISQTLATQIAVLPLLIYSMGDVSLFSLPANILVLLVVPYAMLAGFLAVLVSYLSALLALPLTYISYLLLSWILLISSTLGNLPFATVRAYLPLWLTIFFYVLMVGSISWLQRNSARNSAS